ncbi:MAG: DUF4185 domain-containing protein, partial [Gordonia sp. (in: high G+C Gram-positive bacteria)]
ATVTRQGVPGPRPGSPAIPLPGGQSLPAGPAPDLPAPTFDLRLPDSMGGGTPNPKAPNKPS